MSAGQARREWPAPGGRGRSSWPLRGRDAFFCYVQTGNVAQQIGVLLHLDPLPDGSLLTAEMLGTLLRRRLPALTTLRRVLSDRGRWRKPGWQLADDVDPAAHVRELSALTAEDAHRALDDFWSIPVPTDRPPWQLLLVASPARQVRLGFIMHHSLGDGLSTIATLRRLLDPGPDASTATNSTTTGSPGTPRLGELAQRVRAGAGQAVRTVGGLARLAKAGPAPRSALNRPLDTYRRRLVSTAFPASEFINIARLLRAHPSELACALVSEMLSRSHPPPVPTWLRAQFPVSLPAERRSPTQGNWTAAVTLDLPTAPMSIRARVQTVRHRLRRGLRRGEPAAAELVMSALGRLPQPIHARLARGIYGSRFMNVIVSYMSSTAGAHCLAGAPIAAATPVVALAAGVPVGVAMLRWHDFIEVGVLLDMSLADQGEAMVGTLHEAYDALLPEHSGPVQVAAPHRAAPQ